MSDGGHTGLREERVKAESAEPLVWSSAFSPDSVTR
jgi:hypothetical protein